MKTPDKIKKGLEIGLIHDEGNLIGIMVEYDGEIIEFEPVRHGEWAHLGGDEWCCTVCGEVIHTEGSWEKPTKKYCNECGAKMGGGEL